MRHNPVDKRGGETAVETQAENANTFSAAKQRFLKHCSSLWTKRIKHSQDIAFDSSQSPLLYSFICFFYALEQHALPLSPEQYFTRVSRSAAKSLLLYKDLPIYLEELPEHSSVLFQSTRLKGSHFPLLHQTAPVLS